MLLTQHKSSLASSVSIDENNDPLGLSPQKVDNRKRFLRFLFSHEHEALLPLDCVLEVLQLSSESLLPIPDMPRCISGICKWKGETLWVVDLNALIDQKPLDPHLIGTLSVIVIKHDHRMLGLMVEQVIDIDLRDEDTIHIDPGLCSPNLAPLVIGHCSQPDSVLFDVAAIANNPKIHHR